MNGLQEEHLKFAEELSRLNGAMVKLFQYSDLDAFTEMNAAIKEMHTLENAHKEDEIFKAMQDDLEIVYENFNMIVSVLRTTENGIIDRAAQKAINKLLHNIDIAVLTMARILGVVDGSNN